MSNSEEPPNKNQTAELISLFVRNAPLLGNQKTIKEFFEDEMKQFNLMESKRERESEKLNRILNGTD